MTSPQDAFTFSCTARRRQTETSGVGCCLKKRSNQGRRRHRPMTFFSRAIIAGSLVVDLTLSLAAQHAPARPPAVFTAAQATAGQAAYQSNCASCHQPDLGGQNEAPQLAGTNFRTSWRAKTTKDLIDYMSATMPPGKPSLAAEEYVNIAAFILRSNG